MELTTQTIKQRFTIIGNDHFLNRAIEKAVRVSPTDISVLVTGESGVGKESFPKIIHQLSHRKHNKYIAVNCGAIPEGTIDSELFGHEKGAFTGANSSRKGYFEVADGGTIFLDEVGELPLTTQVRLLRVLENGEFIKVGSSEVHKTNVRIVAATNLNMDSAIQKGKFREDLFYRLSTVEIKVPPLRDRKEDIHLLFRKFASDFAKKYNMPTIRLDENAQKLLTMYSWNGNVRQLRNVAEQLSVLEEKRNVSVSLLKSYLPELSSNLPAVINKNKDSSDFSNEREILYKILFDMKKDLNDLKKITKHLNSEESSIDYKSEEKNTLEKLYNNSSNSSDLIEINKKKVDFKSHEVNDDKYHFAEEISEEETLSIHDKELELIIKALERNGGKRKAAAKELGISERTLYRKIKQHDIEL
jgi:transcriptional regulator with PAS, ATPase and Fis domain